MSFSSISSESDAGPSVATIFAWAGLGDSFVGIQDGADEWDIRSLQVGHLHARMHVLIDYRLYWGVIIGIPRETVLTIPH